MGFRVWKDPGFLWRRSTREWMLELGMFDCATCVGLSLPMDVTMWCKSQTGWDGASWVGVGPHGTKRGPGPAPTLHPLGYAGMSSLDCWEQRLQRGCSSFLPPSFPSTQREIPAEGISSSLPASLPAFPSAKKCHFPAESLVGQL